MAVLNSSGPFGFLFTLFASFILTYLVLTRQEISAKEKTLAKGECPPGEYLIGLKQRYYNWKQGDSDTWRGGIGIGNVSMFCSSEIANETSPDRLFSDWDWGYEKKLWLDYEYGVKYNRTWDQFCNRPVGVFQPILFSKNTYKPLTGSWNMTEHVILSCCYEDPVTRDDLKAWEYVDPVVRNCSSHDGLVGICGIEIIYDDGWYTSKKGDNTWYPYAWGIRRIEPVCCRVGELGSL